MRRDSGAMYFMLVVCIYAIVVLIAIAGERP